MCVKCNITVVRTFSGSQFIVRIHVFSHDFSSFLFTLYVEIFLYQMCSRVKNSKEMEKNVKAMAVVALAALAQRRIQMNELNVRSLFNNNNIIMCLWHVHMHKSPVANMSIIMSSHMA